MNAPGDREPQQTYDSWREAYRTTVDWRQADPVSRQVVTAVADVLGVEPAALEPLADRVEPDALDAIFRPRPRGDRRDGGHVRFRFNGREVTVDARGFVVVGRPTNDGPDVPRLG